MGCPDWPKCFGKWVPPTAESQLPDNYEKIFAEKRLLKNEKLANYLDFLGYNELSQKMINDPGIEEEQPFNAIKTWIEYINRLIGVVIGFLIMGTLATSIPYLKTDKRVFFLALISFVLVVFQGWLGSIVVSTNLLPGMVTVHMLFAILIVILLINAVHISYTNLSSNMVKLPAIVTWTLGLAIFISIVQVVLGTQVREAIDVVAASMNYSGRSDWISQLGSVFPIHRSYSILIVLINAFVIYKLWEFRYKDGIMTIGVLLVSVIILSVFTGMIMAYLGIPKFAQPLHLLMGTVLIGIQFMLFLKSRRIKAV